MFQKQKSKQQYTPATTFFVGVHKITHLSFKKISTLHCSYNDIEPPLHWRSLPNGYCLCCEVYGTSLNLPFASFSKKSEVFTSRFTQIPTSRSLEKLGWNREGKKKPLKSPWSRHKNLGSQFTVVFEKIAFFEKYGKHTRQNYKNLNNKLFQCNTNQSLEMSDAL